MMGGLWPRDGGVRISAWTCAEPSHGQPRRQAVREPTKLVEPPATRPRTTMAWLVVENRAVAPVELATTRKARRRGLLGRQGISGAMLLSPARSVHTVGMKFAIDVAHLDSRMCVLTVRTMRPGRLGPLVRRARHVLETEAGVLQRLGIGPGVRIGVRVGVDPADVG